LSFFQPFIHSNTLVLDKHSSPYALFNISNVSVAVFFNFTQNYRCSWFHFETFDTTKKEKNFTKTTVILIGINQTSLKLHII
jgi:hypothetical protein